MGEFICPPVKKFLKQIFQEVVFLWVNHTLCLNYLPSSTSQKGHHPPPLDEQVVLTSPLCFRVVCIKRRACQPTPVFLPGESPRTEEPAGLQSTGLQRAGHDRETKHSRAQCALNLMKTNSN